jgi:hypothetical protein
MSENESFYSSDFKLRQQDGCAGVDLSLIQIGENMTQRGPAR